ncbi:hypothetical protein C8J57DRAFT_1735188 [Mycena rebaudengoi]|nr:hypothetical protein C8J57DRAFT_1735188 [Mycena rebaudengoi]
MSTRPHHIAPPAPQPKQMSKGMLWRVAEKVVTSGQVEYIPGGVFNAWRKHSLAGALGPEWMMSRATERKYTVPAPPPSGGVARSIPETPILLATRQTRVPHKITGQSRLFSGAVIPATVEEWRESLARAAAATSRVKPCSPEDELASELRVRACSRAEAERSTEERVRAALLKNAGLTYDDLAWVKSTEDTGTCAGVQSSTAPAEDHLPQEPTSRADEADCYEIYETCSREEDERSTEERVRAALLKSAGLTYDDVAWVKSTEDTGTSVDVQSSTTKAEENMADDHLSQETAPRAEEAELPKPHGIYEAGSREKDERSIEERVRAALLENAGLTYDDVAGVKSSEDTGTSTDVQSSTTAAEGHLQQEATPRAEEADPALVPKRYGIYEACSREDTVDVAEARARTAAKDMKTQRNFVLQPLNGVRGRAEDISKCSGKLPEAWFIPWKSSDGSRLFPGPLDTVVRTSVPRAPRIVEPRPVYPPVVWSGIIEELKKQSWIVDGQSW